MSTAESPFASAMDAAGQPCPGVPVADGEIHRYGPRGRYWYVLYADGCPAGAFGDWRSGTKHTWCLRSLARLTQEERTQHRRRMKEAQAARIRSRRQAQLQAAKKAKLLWDRAKPADPRHPYLARKRIKPDGVRQMGLAVLVAMRDAEGNIWNVQRIRPDGRKWFLEGGRVSGLCAAIGKPRAVIAVCEGYATGASIHEATGWAVAAAFTCHNLEAVARSLRAKSPSADLVVAADNDTRTEGNPGLRHATKAADAVGARLAVPVFQDTRQPGSDFNDLHLAEGLHVVREKLEGVRAPEPEATPGEALPEAPHGYRLTGSGVFVVHQDKDDERLTHAPVYVSAISRDGVRENWGFLVKWLDRDGEHHTRAIPAGNLHEQGNATAQELANAGLAIVPGKERALLRYLAAFNPELRLTAATATGWTGDAFVLPERTINAPPGSAIVFQPPAHHAAADAIRAAGALDNWRREVAEPAGAADLPAFLLSAALAAPLFHLAGLECGGFHLYGTTSRGKTTALQGAASVWGSGADPASAGGAGAFVERWNMTANATEGLAESRNDLPLILDEIGETDARDFGRTLYRIVSGSGRARATRDGGLRRRSSWRTLVLSAGEVRVSHHIREGGGTVRGGHLVRLAELPADNIFPEAQAADAMKRVCARFYGTAGPAFLEYIAGDLAGIRDEIAALERIAEHVGEAGGNEQGRVRKRFALVALAGELAIQAGVLPWRSGRALEAARAMFAAWTGAQDATTDAERGIASVRSFVLAHGSGRFEREDEKRPIQNRAGWYRGGCYHFTTEAFVEACGGVLPETVKKALRDAGHLVTDGADRLRNRIRVENQRVDVVSVRGSILERAVPGTQPTGDAPGAAEIPVDTGPSPVSPVPSAGITSPVLARGQGGGDRG